MYSTDIYSDDESLIISSCVFETIDTIDYLVQSAAKHSNNKEDFINCFFQFLCRFYFELIFAYSLYQNNLKDSFEFTSFEETIQASKYFDVKDIVKEFNKYSGRKQK